MFLQGAGFPARVSFRKPEASSVPRPSRPAAPVSAAVLNIANMLQVLDWSPPLAPLCSPSSDPKPPRTKPRTDEKTLFSCKSECVSSSFPNHCQPLPSSQLSEDSRNCRQGDCGRSNNRNLGLREHCSHGPCKSHAPDRRRNVSRGGGLCNVSKNRTD